MANRSHLRDRFSNPRGQARKIDGRGKPRLRHCHGDAPDVVFLGTHILPHLAVRSVPTSPPITAIVTKSCPATGNCHESPVSALPRNHDIKANQSLTVAIRELHPNSDETATALMEETSTTLTSWFEDIGRIVMGRPDGRFLGSQWLLLKGEDERVGRGRGGDPGDQRYLRQADLIEWIACGLAKAGLTGSEVANLAELPDTPDVGKVVVVQQLSRADADPPPRLGALSMSTVLDHMIGSASSDMVAVQLDRLDVLLAARDPSFEVEAALATGPRDLPAYSCGHLFAYSEEPVARWQQSWELLVEQRRRAQHWREMQDADALAPSLFLLATGTLCVDWLIASDQVRADHAKELWREVFDSARDCWLTVSLQPLSERIETHIGRLFARHPRVFGASGDSTKSEQVGDAGGYSKILAQDLAMLGGDDLMLTICCLNAFHNGVGPAEMKQVVFENSGQIDALLRQFERWQTYERRVRKRTDIVEMLADLRTAIESL